jgi:tetratricopeptide (TPR) repeat protein
MLPHRSRALTDHHHAAQRVSGPLHANDAEQLYCLAIRLYETKHYANALRLMEYLLRTEKTQAKLLRTTAIILQADEQFERALDLYTRALSLDEHEDPLITLGLAQSLVYMKRFNEALPYLHLTQDRLKHSTVKPQLRNQLVRILVPLMERVQQLKTSVL